MTEPKLSVVLPVYNESERLERSFAELLPFLESLGRSFELVCVDDGSTDDSLARLRETAGKDARVRVEALPVNRGKGAAVRAGMLAARGEQVLFMDVDLSTGLDATGRVLAALDEGCDVVLGSRHVERARIDRHQPWLREKLGKGFRWTSTRLFAPQVRDFTCGFKGFEGHAAQEIFRRSRIDRWAFDVELVVIARELGLHIGQVGVSWQHEEGSKVRVFGAVLGSLRDWGRILLHRALGRYR